jgi:hypothetical protein
MRSHRSRAVGLVALFLSSLMIGLIANGSRMVGGREEAGDKGAIVVRDFSSAVTIALLSEAMVVDVRTRRAFQDGSLLGALNIPLEELVPRAKDEVPIVRGLVVVCEQSDQCDRLWARSGVQTPCALAADEFSRLGAKDVTVIRASKADWLRAGWVVRWRDFRLRLSYLNDPPD